MPVDYAFGFRNPVDALWSPLRPDYDYFNAPLRDNYNPDYDSPCDPVGHRGVDIYPAPKGVVGLSIVSSQAGKVRRVDPSDDSAAGVYVEVLHAAADGGWYLTRYLHLVSFSVTVSPGQYLVKGQQLGKMGKTGNANSPHLHFEIRYSANPKADLFAVYGADWGCPYDPLAFGILTPAPPSVMLDRIVVDRPRLKLGSSGQAVAELQFLLQAGLTLDGKFGPITEAAVVTYQTASGLTADGKVGGFTWTALLDY